MVKFISNDLVVFSSVSHGLRGELRLLAIDWFMDLPIKCGRGPWEFLEWERRGNGAVKHQQSSEILSGRYKNPRSFIFLETKTV